MAVAFASDFTGSIDPSLPILWLPFHLHRLNTVPGALVPVLLLTYDLTLDEIYKKAGKFFKHRNYPAG